MADQTEQGDKLRQHIHDVWDSAGKIRRILSEQTQIDGDYLDVLLVVCAMRGSAERRGVWQTRAMLEDMAAALDRVDLGHLSQITGRPLDTGSGNA